MNLEVIDVSLELLKNVDVSNWLQQFRQKCVYGLRIRFSKVPWTSILLCAPSDHIFGMVYQLLPPSLAKWTVTIDDFGKQMSLFNREHANNGILLSKIPAGFYNYGSTNPRLPRESRIGIDVPSLSRFWYWPFLIPQTHECEELFIDWIREILDQLNWFVLRPFSNNKIYSEVEPSRGNKRQDYLLFCEEGAYSILKTPERGITLNQVGSLLDQAVQFCDRGGRLDRDSLSPWITQHGKCMMISVQGALSNDINIVHNINSLRAKLIRLLGWPIFFETIVALLLQHHGKGRSRVTFQEDTVLEMRDYVSNCLISFPGLIDDPYSSAWNQGRMMKGGGITLRKIIKSNPTFFDSPPFSYSDLLNII